jgi:undecaprenyl-diphosphatase
MIEYLDKIGIDLFFGSDSVFLDQMALVLTNTYAWVPMFIALFILIIKNNDNVQQILLVMGCIALCVFLASGTSNLLVKPLVERVRPCNDPQYKYLAQIAGDMHSKDFSFFSSHAANTMAVATFFTFLSRSLLLSVTLYAWSLINMWTRLYLGQHFLTDILVGMIWGIVSACIAYAVFYSIYKNMSTGKKYVSTQYTVTGYSYLDVDVVVSLFFLTLCCSTIPLIEIYHNLIRLIH